MWHLIPSDVMVSSATLTALERDAIKALAVWGTFATTRNVPSSPLAFNIRLPLTSFPYQTDTSTCRAHLPGNRLQAPGPRTSGRPVQKLGGMGYRNTGS